MEYLNAILSSLTPAAVASVFFIVVGYVAKKTFEKWISDGTVRYKTELDRTLFEHQTRFAQLQTRRAEVIAEFYTQLQNVEDIYVRIAENVRQEIDLELSVDTDIDANIDDAELFDDAYNDLRLFFQRNRLYFSEALCERIDQVLNALAVSQFFLTVSREGTASHEECAAFSDAGQQLRSILNPTKRSVENEFRVMLGVNCSNT